MKYVKRKCFLLVSFGFVALTVDFFLKLGQDEIDDTSIKAILPTSEKKKVMHYRDIYKRLSSSSPAPTVNTPAQQIPTDTFIENQSDGYIKFNGMDIHNEGDFPCADSLAKGSCLILRKRLSDFELNCDRIGPYCKGFVVKKNDKGQILAYFKRNLGVPKPNKDTNLFIKREFIDKKLVQV